MESAEVNLDELPAKPHDPAQRDAWRGELARWRDEARIALRYDDARYRVPELAWTASCFVCAMVMLWDHELCDPEAGGFRADEFLEWTEARYGGVDAVVLWQAYPRIGFDERNQFDFYREGPGGLAGLRALITACHARGVRAILDYNPWDVGTRAEAGGDVHALTSLVAETGADGIFLDTLAQASEGLRGQLDAIAPWAALQSEHLVPLDRVTDHLMSWLQWPPMDGEPYPLRNKWFEQRHMQHLVRRWHRDHTDELHLAWLNGAGIVVWEDVFGSANPWRPRDLALLRQMRPVQRELAGVLSAGNWAPLVATSHQGLYASRWESGDMRLWTVVNAAGQKACGPLIPVDARPGEQLFDLIAGRPVTIAGAAITGEIPARGIGAFASVTSERGRSRLGGLLAPRGRIEAGPPPVPARPRAWSEVSVAKSSPARRPAAGGCPDGMQPFGPVSRDMTVRYRLRECGLDGPAQLADQVQPALHQVMTERRHITVGRYAIDQQPVTNAQFARFIDATGYRPKLAESFLRHWQTPAAPGPEQAELPVTYVDIADAVAYARWLGRRLPTQEEWQHALESGTVGYGQTRVWEWTDSVRLDGRTRSCVVKGGADYQASGSEWYADGGPRLPDWAAKFILYWPGLDRCSTIGFRCAVDLPP